MVADVLLRLLIDEDTKRNLFKLSTTMICLVDFQVIKFEQMRESIQDISKVFGKYALQIIKKRLRTQNISTEIPKKIKNSMASSTSTPPNKPFQL